MRGASGRLIMAASLTSALLVSAAPAHAVDVPAYGTITITNDGLGAVPTWTYDPALWSCRTEFTGVYVAPTVVTVTCVAYQSSAFVCPLMVLTTSTRGGRAGGSASCTTSIDTGMVRGFDSRTVSGNLGRAYRVRCQAYGDEAGGLIPPYTVTCAEPGLPRVAG